MTCARGSSPSRSSLRRSHTRKTRSLTAPASATVGAAVEVGWQGAAEPRDFITIVPSDAAEGRYLAYEYTRTSPVTLTASDQPGSYEIRYLGAASPYPTLARAPLTVVDATATLEAPATVPAGEDIAVRWTGPDNAREFIALVKADAAEGTYNGPYKYTREGSPLTLRAPDASGDYELRYLMANTPYRTLGRRPVRVTSTTASLTAPARVAAGAPFAVQGQGPDNARDFIAIVPAGAPERTYDVYVYTEVGNPAQVAAPEVAGEYEVRYLTANQRIMLGKRAITIAPRPAPGTLRVVATPAAAPALEGATVAVVFDASGSMLQRLNGERRAALPGRGTP